MNFDSISLVRAGDDPQAQVVISKAEPELQEDQMGDKIKKDGLDADVIAYIEELEQDNTDLSKSLTDAEAELLIAKGEVIEKSDETSLLEKADPAIKALFEAQAAKIEKADKAAEFERNARLTKEYISKAEALPTIAVDDTVEGGLAGLLRRAADKMDPKDLAGLEKAFADANEKIVKGDLFSEKGRSGEQSTISKSVDSLAEEIRKADPTLTIEQATVEAYKRNPELAEQALNDKE